MVNLREFKYALIHSSVLYECILEHTEIAEKGKRDMTSTCRDMFLSWRTWVSTDQSTCLWITMAGVMDKPPKLYPPYTEMIPTKRLILLLKLALVLCVLVNLYNFLFTVLMQENANFVGHGGHIVTLSNYTYTFKTAGHDISGKTFSVSKWLLDNMDFPMKEKVSLDFRTRFCVT